jgi:hypothetical protein
VVSDIQHHPECAISKWGRREPCSCPPVPYADHVAALAQSEQALEALRAEYDMTSEANGLMWENQRRDYYRQGQRDALTALDACQSVDDAVNLLKTIGLDITYTDEGLRAIARQIVGYGQRDALAATDDFLHDDPCDCDQCLVVLRVRNRLREVIYGYPIKGDSDDR